MYPSTVNGVNHVKYSLWQSKGIELYVDYTSLHHSSDSIMEMLLILGTELCGISEWFPAKQSNF